MNKKIIYFILFIVAYSKLVSIERLDIDELINEKTNKIKNKDSSKIMDESDNKIDIALNDDYDSKANNIVSNKLDLALSKNNVTNIVSDESTFENETIVNEPVVTSNNEKAGGVSDMIIIFGIILTLLYLLKK